MTPPPNAVAAVPPTPTPESGLSRPTSPFGGGWLPRAFDAALVVLLLSAGFLLACTELSDADVWWHLKGGQWILEHGRVPGLDPFSFGSADQVWVDIHWLFDVAGAFLFGRGGLAAVILLGAAAATAALAIAISARGRSWPAPLVVLLWVPCLVLMASRFIPRPEVFTMLYLAAYLAVLWHAGERPRLLYLLPLVQLLWVNTHGLFALGPMVLCFYALGQGAEWAWCRWRAVPPPVRRRPWRHLAASGVLVVLACLANPYFLDGALFPFQLLAKVAAPGNVYKEYIAEFHSPRDVVQVLPGDLGAAKPDVRALFFLLLVLPVSFVLPAAWDLWRRAGAGQPANAAAEGRAAGWVGVLAGAVGLAAVATAALPGWATARWLAGAGVVVAAGFAALAAAGAWFVRGRSWAAAMLALSAGGFLAAWAAWLRAYLLDRELPAVPLSLVIAAAAAVVPLTLVAVRPGGAFRLLLVGAFGFLALNAFRNASLLGLVGGVVLIWNIGEWLALLAISAPAGRSSGAAAGWALRLGALALLGAWVLALATDRYFPWVGQPRRLGLGEQPFTFAHDAARFAGREGLPERALIYDIAQAAVYLFHNGPRCKTFIDPRLELPAPDTFARYVGIEQRLQKRDPQWADDLHVPGDLLVLLSHTFPANAGAEATLLADAGWRCVHYDALASVFVRRGVAEAVAGDEDFAGRLLRPASCPVVPGGPGAASREALALFWMAMALGPSPPVQPRRTAVLLGAVGRAGEALHEDDSSAAAWTALGDCLGALLSGPTPPVLTDRWEPSRVLPWAQATYCYGKALARAPNDPSVLLALYQAYAARQMADAQLDVGKRLRALGAAGPELESQLDGLQQFLAETNRRTGPPEETPDAVMNMLASYQPMAAARLAERMERRQAVAWPWAVADNLATAYLHLGRPADARRVWEHAKPPSAADRLCRLATTYWVERDFEAAVRRYQQALRDDPKRAEAWWGLAMIHTQAAQAAAALDACRQGLWLQPTEPQRAALQQLQELLPPYAAARD
jgi:tetratricopeptide (TPR) repeat protein